jgi:hypothetical protein
MANNIHEVVPFCTCAPFPVTNIHETVPFCAYAPFLVLLPFVNASRKQCSARVISTAYDSASVTSVM